VVEDWLLKGKEKWGLKVVMGIIGKVWNCCFLRDMLR